MNPEEIINVNPNILSGTPVFRGTRVPVESLFAHLERGIALDDFLDDFPAVKKEQAIAILEIAGKMFRPEHLHKLYETAA